MKVIFPILVITTFALLTSPSNAYPPAAVPEFSALFAQGKYDRAASVMETYLAANRFDSNAWSSLGATYHRARQFERAIVAYQKAIELGSNPSAEMYNIACAYALSDKKEDAINWLAKALDAGFPEQETLEKDDDLKSLRDDPRFFALTGLNPPNESSPEKRWTSDLDFFARRMQQMHWSLYAKVSKETFLGEVDKLKHDAPKLDPAHNNDRARVRLSRIIALAGDGHTSLGAFADGEDSIGRIPLHLCIFPDATYIIGATPDHRDLIGAQVIKVGSLDIADAIQKLRPFCSVDNEMGYLARTPLRLLHAAALQEIAAVPDTSKDNVQYTLKMPDGATKIATLAPVPLTRDVLRGNLLFRPGFIYANAPADAVAKSNSNAADETAAKSSPPLYQRDLDKSLTLERLDDLKAVYFGFHAVAENNGQSFKEFIDGLTKLLDESHAENLIIDMRLNGGGNTDLVQPLIFALIKNDRINRAGHLFVIIGRDTFSAAQNTVNMIETMTHATFVGEPTGSRPAFVGESTYFVLPYSKLRVYCSSRYWQILSSTDHRTWVQPQIAAELTFKDFAENRDPCMDAITARIKATKE